jgi:hypothetical protein
MHICSEEINAFLAFFSQLVPGWTWFKTWLQMKRNGIFWGEKVV